MILVRNTISIEMKFVTSNSSEATQESVVKTLSGCDLVYLFSNAAGTRLLLWRGGESRMGLSRDLGSI